MFFAFPIVVLTVTKAVTRAIKVSGSRVKVTALRSAQITSRSEKP